MVAIRILKDGVMIGSVVHSAGDEATAEMDRAIRLVEEGAADYVGAPSVAVVERARDWYGPQLLPTRGQERCITRTERIAAELRVGPGPAE